MRFHPPHPPVTARHPRRMAVLLAFVLTLSFLVVGQVRPADAATCPCSIFTATQTPVNPSENDTDPVELGVKFRADTDGAITAIRFYKGTGNGGTHTGSLWNSTGTTRLSTVTFTAETATGWQQASLPAPIAVTAGTTYVASYYAPQGHYAGDNGAFANAAVANPPLTALQNGTDGGNGVYRYGTGGGFPNTTYQSTNYWVDVVFTSNAVDTTKPTVTDRQPAAGATNVPVTTGVSATFSEAVQPATIVMTVSSAAGAVAGTSSYDATTRTRTFTPSAALAVSTTYTVNVSGTKDTAGNLMDPVSWTFTTAATVTACLCSIWADTVTPGTPSANDNSAVEVGLRFRADRAGFVTGLRFYKGAGNTGTHVGSLWNSTGTTRLSSVTFTGETATGWQRATLPSPIPVAANTTYVASYYAPVGRYSSNGSYFATAATTRGPLTALKNGTDGANGVYRYGATGFPNSTYQSSNYWVDVVFNTTASDTTAPTVSSTSPANGANGIPTNSAVTATFSEPVVGSSVSLELRNPSNALVPGTLSYDAATQTETLAPSSALTTSTTYTAKVSGARDSSGNTMTAVTWTFSTAAPAPPPPDQGPGGPIAVVTSNSNPYSKYLAEILRTEGLNEFSTVDVGSVSASTLAPFDTVVLGNVPVTAAQTADLTSWVNAGGNLIAIRPGSTLSSLLGLSVASGTTSDAYLKVDPTTAPGAGIVTDTIQYHGVADRYTLSGAQAIATLYSTATTATTSPAVSLRDVGSNGGQAAAFTFDLPRSIALTRQGNPAWAGTERDGNAPIRSDDMFFGGTGATDWVNLSKVAIPQADEQQRLLTNLIQVMNRDRKPLPHFWYFPRNLKAVIIATGDDHGNNGTAGRFDQYLANSPAGCSVADWTCPRFSSYIYPSTPLSNAAAAGYAAQGFEIGVHESTNCGNFTLSSLQSFYANDIAAWRARFPSLANPVSNRTHCIAFSDWASQPKVALANGMRMDGNYYYWPDTWVQDRPGFMTGSGMPMRFTDTDGTMIDNYQAPSQLTDESGQTYPMTPNALLDNATGPLGYYGAFNANMHTDSATTFEDDNLIASAQAHGVPLVSGKQMVSWIDGRNASSFTEIAWTANTLSFGISVGAGANGLSGMLPTAGPNGTQLTALTRDGSAVAFTKSTVKGLEYASFTAATGAYAATYAATGAPAIAQNAVVATQARTAAAAVVTWDTTEPTTSEVSYGTAPGALTSKAKLGDASRKHRVKLAGLRKGTRYYYRLTSQDTTGSTVLFPASGATPASFTTAAADTATPKLANPGVTVLTGGSATATWTTSEPTSSILRYGTSADRLTAKVVDDGLVTDHTVTLTGLDLDRTYWVAATATDASGNTTTSKTFRFITIGSGVVEQTTASFRRGTSTGQAAVDDTGQGSVTLTGTGAGRSGTFVSGVLDAQAMVDWDRVAWRAKVPAGSTLTVSGRVGSTNVPDGTWSRWKTVKSGQRVQASGRYVQYRLELRASGATSPALFAIGVSNNGHPIAVETEVK